MHVSKCVCHFGYMYTEIAGRGFNVNVVRMCLAFLTYSNLSPAEDDVYAWQCACIMASAMISKTNCAYYVLVTSGIYKHIDNSLSIGPTDNAKT